MMTMMEAMMVMAMMMAMGGAANLNWVQVASSDYSLHSNRPNVLDDDDDDDGIHPK